MKCLEKHQAVKAAESNLSIALVDLREALVVARFRNEAVGKIALRGLNNLDAGNSGRYTLVYKPGPEDQGPEDQPPLAAEKLSR